MLDQGSEEEGIARSSASPPSRKIEDLDDFRPVAAFDDLVHQNVKLRDAASNAAEQCVQNRDALEISSDTRLPDQVDNASSVRLGFSVGRQRYGDGCQSVSVVRVNSACTSNYDRVSTTRGRERKSLVGHTCWLLACDAANNPGNSATSE
ncbi:MAG TPA: hypothetical protein VL326_25885 [Kofleriaceae bacterium]|nr:hypothetical protein [Kofleriaceae bacterium]